MRDVKEKVVLVTGGSTGIGLATAMRFAEAGARVVIAAHSDSEEVRRRLTSYSPESSFFVTDVSRQDELERLFADIESKYGRLDYAFNNAGSEGEKAAFEEQTTDTFDRVMATNVRGVWLAMQMEIRLFLKQGGGAIVNAASIFSFVGYPQSAVYSASKGAVLGLTRTAALEHAKNNIRVNAVAPGAIETSMSHKGMESLPGGKEKYIASLAIGRLGRPQEVADAVVYLLAEATYTTGQALIVDGGITAA